MLTTDGVLMLACDSVGCLASIMGLPTPNALAEWAKGRGWVRQTNVGPCRRIVWFCPACAEKRKDKTT